MANVWSIFVAAGIPTAVVGLLMWLLKRHIDKKESARVEREKNVEDLILITLRNSRATNILAEATARAVQRIPDAHCNGDMTAALAEAEKIQKEEKDFLMNHGVKHIFEQG